MTFGIKLDIIFLVGERIERQGNYRMSECQSKSTCSKESCEGCSQNEAPDFRVPGNEHSKVQKVIGVVSGKGGVGKSMITSLLAVEQNRKGFKTAILDADITGPSIPKAFGLQEQAMQGEYGILPAVTTDGIEVMSVNLLLQDETDPVVWRGPVISGTVKQFWSDVYWGDVDYMFVDMPPGTGDVALTVFQSLPLDGIVIVTSPQELVSMIVTKAVKMAEMMNIPILALVENMSYFACPDCGKKHAIFGESHIDEVAAMHGIDTVVKLPMDPALAQLCDAGLIEEVSGDPLKGLGEALHRKI